MQSCQLTPVRDWSGIRALRRQLDEELSGLPEEWRCELAMVAAELAENGLRYADRSGGGPCVLVELERAAGFVELRVTTRLKAPQQAREVLGRILAIEAAEDKERAYVERLLELARGEVKASSELGFHRIATEGRCSLRATHEGEQLTIQARRAL